MSLELYYVRSLLYRVEENANECRVEQEILGCLWRMEEEEEQCGLLLLYVAFFAWSWLIDKME